MTKADLVEKVAEAVGPRVTKRECGLMVEAFLDAVRDALAQGDRIELRGFGVFRVRHRKARTGRNHRTGAPVEVPSRDVPVFEPSRYLRSRVDRGLRVLGKEANRETGPRAIALPSMPRCGPAVIPSSRRRFRWLEPRYGGRASLPLVATLRATPQG